MKTIIKYLKPFMLSIIIIIGLLFIQAQSELELPKYMSDIINKGVQQKGIERPIPLVIRESEFNKLIAFSDNSTKIKEYYKLINKDNLNEDDYLKYVEDYPLLSSESLYILNTDINNIGDEFDLLISKSISIIYGLKMGLNIDNIDKTMIEDKLKNIPESMLISGSINYITEEYEIIGINTADIQNNYVIITGLKMVFLTLFAALVSILVGYISARLASKLGRNLRSDLFRKVVSFSNVEFNRFGTSSLITRSTNDVSQIQNMLVMALRIVFYAPILGIGAFINVINTDISMGWLIGATLGVILIILFFAFLLAVPKFRVVQQLIDRLNLVMRESLIGMLVIRAFNNEKHEEARFDKVNQELTDTNLFINKVMVLVMPLMMLVMNIVTLLIVWIGANQIDAGILQIGEMMAFIQYAMQIIMSFLMISMMMIILPRSFVSISRIDEVLITDPVIKDDENPKSLNDKIKGNLKFDNVSFKYKEALDYVLKDISFEAKKGEITAIIGGTGSGKSTIVNLINRFYDVSKGNILLNDVDIRDLTQHDLRSVIGYVPQKGVLFKGTILSNLKYGNEEASISEIEKTVKIAQAYDFINEKEQGFDETIAEGGTNVSGGQKQRLAIARALLKKPQIYIFDDAFGALDFKTDKALRNALSKNISNSTVIIVAQRIGTIMNADQIIVLDEGKIVGIGKHANLMKTCKVYKEIALSQLTKGELDNE